MADSSITFSDDSILKLCLPIALQCKDDRVCHNENAKYPHILWKLEVTERSNDFVTILFEVASKVI